MNSQIQLLEDDCLGETPKLAGGKPPMNSNMHKAKTKKNDEFYTRRPDIEAELQHYEHHFKGKVVYCNCDDPAWSQFVAYFQDNFTRLGLAELLTNHYDPATGTGDFMSREAVAKLDRADIVVTNPPFSLFRKYVAQLMGSTPVPLLSTATPPNNKKFLIVGNLNAIACRDIFVLARDKKMWAGVNNQFAFTNPDGSTQSMGMVMWFTNLTHGHARPMSLTRKYNPELHRQYENYDAVNADKIKDFPCDYYGAVGVPITIFQGYDISQFDIIGVTENIGRGLSGGLWYKKSKVTQALVDGKRRYNRVFIRRRVSCEG